MSHTLLSSQLWTWNQSEMETGPNISCFTSLKFCCLLVLGFGLFFLIIPASSASLANHSYTPCNGSIAECSEESEQMMESEISRRLLAQQKSISYGALKPDQPACGGGARGQAYTSNGGCIPPPSNPPTRGCSKYYRCRTGGSWFKLFICLILMITSWLKLQICYLFEIICTMHWFSYSWNQKPNFVCPDYCQKLNFCNS